MTGSSNRPNHARGLYTSAINYTTTGTTIHTHLAKDNVTDRPDSIDGNVGVWFETPIQLHTADFRTADAHPCLWRTDDNVGVWFEIRIQVHTNKKIPPFI